MAQVTTLHVCTNGPCRNNGGHVTLVELEELANLVQPAGACTVARYNCFGHCGRGPNVNINRANGSQMMMHGVRSTEQALDVIERASGVRPKATGPLAARLQELRRVSAMEQELTEVQAAIDVLDCSPAAQRASAKCQQQYDHALARVDRVLSDSPKDAHPRKLAEAIRRQVVAAKAGRSASPEVEDVLADDPGTWPED